MTAVVGVDMPGDYLTPARKEDSAFQQDVLEVSAVVEKDMPSGLTSVAKEDSASQHDVLKVSAVVENNLPGDLTFAEQDDRASPHDVLKISADVGKDAMRKKVLVTKSQKKATRRLIAQLDAEVDSLEQVDEHGEEIEANGERRHELLSQLQELGA